APGLLAMALDAEVIEPAASVPAVQDGGAEQYTLPRVHIGEAGEPEVVGGGDQHGPKRHAEVEVRQRDGDLAAECDEHHRGDGAGVMPCCAARSSRITARSGVIRPRPAL